MLAGGSILKQHLQHRGNPLYHMPRKYCNILLVRTQQKILGTCSILKKPLQHRENPLYHMPRKHCNIFLVRTQQKI